MKKIKLTGHQIVKGTARGEALVGSDPISFWGTVDIKTGVVQEKDHSLEGECIKGKILVYPTGKGSSGGAARLYSLIKAGIGPKAIINEKAEIITTIGAIMGEIPVMDQISENPMEVIDSGDIVYIDTIKGTIEVTKKDRIT